MRAPKPQLLLLDGASGAGKSMLLAHLRGRYASSICVGRKLTTRAPRAGDNAWEFEFVDRISPGAFQHAFESVGNQYALNSEEIEAALERGKVYAVTCVDRVAMERLRASYHAIVIYVYRPVDKSSLARLLHARGEISDLEANARTAEVESVGKAFASKIQLYDHVLLNISTPSDLLEQLDTVLAAHGLSDNESVGK